LQARARVRSEGLRSYRQWVAWKKAGHRPRCVPANPAQTYKGLWAGYADWLGYEEEGEEEEEGEGEAVAVDGELSASQKAAAAAERKAERLLSRRRGASRGVE
jgi:hypothetical protein